MEKGGAGGREGEGPAGNLSDQGLQRRQGAPGEAPGGKLGAPREGAQAGSGGPREAAGEVGGQNRIGLKIVECP